MKSNLSVDICYIESGFKQKMKYANRMNNKYVLIIGDDEISKNVVVLKNMISGEQKELSLDDLSSIDLN
jgi:histidyl-tRNA synthetase